LRNFSNQIIAAFPFWVIGGSILAMFYPNLFVWVKPYIAFALTIIMIGMGLTLHVDEFKRILKKPLYIGLAVLLQFTIMPLSGWFIGYIFDLNKALATGMIIVACCPGGASSNVICYLARVNVALSVSMTAVSTILAIIMTPLLTTLLIGDIVEVSGWKLFLDTIKVVLFPVILGITLNTFFPKFTKKIVPYSPLVALAAIIMIVGAIIGDDRELLIEHGLRLIAAVTTLHAFGFGLGYIFSKILTKNEQASRTTAIEVGMQNSGLGAVLAKDNFPLLIGVAAPSALASSIHNVLGSILVLIFRKWPSKDDI
jgi:bile acid:Na+ symporter, BASS family